MSAAQNLFSAQASTFALNATATPSAAVQMPYSSNVVRIVNEGPAIAFIAIGAAGVVATLPATLPGGAAVTCTPVLPGSDITLSQAYGATPNYVSAVCRSGGTAVITMSTGESM